MNPNLKEIKIKCHGSMTLELSQLEIIQGDLKDLSKKNFEKLKKQIIERGFSAPFFIWKDVSGPTVKYKLLDGTQRCRVLNEMKRDGWKIPRLPACEIEAENIHEAKRKLLAFASEYGNMTQDGLFAFSHGDIALPELEDFRFPEINLKSFAEDFYTTPEETPEEENKPPKVCPHCGELL